MRKKSSGGGEPIETWDGIFADPEVGRVLHANGLIADANKSSIEELGQITSLNPSGSYNTSYFFNNKVITKFPELKYCTGLRSLYAAFRECSNLTEITIPEGVTNMTDTFFNCTNLTEVGIIPDSVKIMSNTFSHCSSLVEVIIPEGVISMTNTFNMCESLISAPAIPEGVDSVSYTFYECSNLDGIFIIKPVTPPTYRSTFFRVNVVTIYVPDESVDIYKSASGWSDYSDKIYPMSELPE